VINETSLLAYGLVLALAWLGFAIGRNGWVHVYTGRIWFGGALVCSGVLFTLVALVFGWMATTGRM
jgi:hypothetical protein